MNIHMSSPLEGLQVEGVMESNELAAELGLFAGKEDF